MVQGHDDSDLGQDVGTVMLRGRQLGARRVGRINSIC